LLCNRVLDELGLSDHQALVGLHHDVKYPGSDKTRTHAHLLINLVNDAGKCFDTRWDYYKIPKVLRHLERCYGLQAVPDVGEVGKQRDSSGQYRLERRSFENPPVPENSAHSAPRSVRRKLQDMIDEVLRRCGSFEELAIALESLGVGVHSTSQGWWVQYQGLAFAGYQLGRAYTKPSVLKRLEVEQMADVEQENSGGFDNEQVVSSTNVELPTDGVQETSGVSEVGDEQPVSSMQEVFLSQSESETVEFANSKPELSELGSQVGEREPQNSEGEPESSEPTEKPERQRVEPVVKDSPKVETPNSQTGQQAETSENPNSADWINQIKQQAHQLEQTELIDGKFYTGMALDVTAHLAELGEVGKEILQSIQNPEGSTSPKPEAVAKSLSQFVKTRAGVHDLNVREPIATNLGTLRLDPDENTVSITRNITVAQWDEDSQEWQIPGELADEHQNSVGQLLNNEAVDVGGYKFSGDDSERVITFEQIRFRALHTDEGWQVSQNSLTEDEQNRILKLPQSEEDYTRTANGKDLVNYFQRHASEQFEEDIGVIHWTAENGLFDRRFEVSLQPDESRIVAGFDLKRTDDGGNPRQIFRASIGADHSIDCSQCDISTTDIDKLLKQEISRQPEQKPEPERSQQQTPQKQQERTR
jgi:hypothetical protein